MTNREEWRNLVIEDALMPHLPIVDAHHHLWQTPRRERLDPYLPEALFADITGSGHNVIATVYVDCFANYRDSGPEHLRVVGETEYVDSVAEEAIRIGGKVAGACSAIVGNGDLMLGAAVSEILDAHIDASTRFRGIRRMTLSDVDAPIMPPELMASAPFREGFKELAKRQLTFDASCFHSQLNEVVDLARAFPEVTIVLNHTGTPLGTGRYADGRVDGFAEWKRNMSNISKCENIVVKIGGLNMESSGLGVSQDAVSPMSSEQLALRQRNYILHTIDLFGPKRCIFESNFPVDMWYVSYTLLWNVFKRVVEDFSAEDLTDLFSETANRVYRLNLEANS